MIHLDDGTQSLVANKKTLTIVERWFVQGQAELAVNHRQDAGGMDGPECPTMFEADREIALVQSANSK